MQQTIINYDDVPYLFIVDRIRETSWSSRQYIADLLELARYIERNGPHSYAGALFYGNLKSRYPVEHAALQIEIHQGRHVTTAEFQHMQDEAQQKRAEGETQKLRHQQQVATQQQQQLEAAYTSWRLHGGRP